VNSAINSDQTHTDRHGITSREITDGDHLYLYNIARELRDKGWDVKIKTGTHKGEVYWILAAVKHP